MIKIFSSVGELLPTGETLNLNARQVDILNRQGFIQVVPQMPLESVDLRKKSTEICAAVVVHLYKPVYEIDRLGYHVLAGVYRAES